MSVYLWEFSYLETFLLYQDTAINMSQSLLIKLEGFLARNGSPNKTVSYKSINICLSMIKVGVQLSET